MITIPAPGRPSTSPSRRPVLATLLTLTITTQLAACGTLIYPERKGQTDGRIDVGVAVLDAVGLLFFVVPGLVAFAVDFTTGAIYLPDGGIVNVSSDEMERIKNNDGTVNQQGLKQVMDNHLSQSSDAPSLPLSHLATDLEVQKVASVDQLHTLFAEQAATRRLALSGQQPDAG